MAASLLLRCDTCNFVTSELSKLSPYYHNYHQSSVFDVSQLNSHRDGLNNASGSLEIRMNPYFDATQCTSNFCSCDSRLARRAFVNSRFDFDAMLDEETLTSPSDDEHETNPFQIDVENFSLDQTCRNESSSTQISQTIEKPRSISYVDRDHQQCQNSDEHDKEYLSSPPNGIACLYGSQIFNRETLFQKEIFPMANNTIAACDSAGTWRCGCLLAPVTEDFIERELNNFAADGKSREKHRMSGESNEQNIEMITKNEEIETIIISSDDEIDKMEYVAENFEHALKLTSTKSQALTVVNQEWNSLYSDPSLEAGNYISAAVNNELVQIDDSIEDVEVLSNISSPIQRTENYKEHEPLSVYALQCRVPPMKINSEGDTLRPNGLSDEYDAPTVQIVSLTDPDLKSSKFLGNVDVNNNIEVCDGDQKKAEESCKKKVTKSWKRKLRNEGELPISSYQTHNIVCCSREVTASLVSPRETFNYSANLETNCFPSRKSTHVESESIRENIRSILMSDETSVLKTKSAQKESRLRDLNTGTILSSLDITITPPIDATTFNLKYMMSRAHNNSENNYSTDNCGACYGENPFGSFSDTQESPKREVEWTPSAAPLSFITCSVSSPFPNPSPSSQYPYPLSFTCSESSFPSSHISLFSPSLTFPRTSSPLTTLVSSPLPAVSPEANPQVRSKICPIITTAALPNPLLILSPQTSIPLALSSPSSRLPKDFDARKNIGSYDQDLFSLNNTKIVYCGRTSVAASDSPGRSPPIFVSYFSENLNLRENGHSGYKSSEYSHTELDFESNTSKKFEDSILKIDCQSDTSHVTSETSENSHSERFRKSESNCRLNYMSLDPDKYASRTLNTRPGLNKRLGILINSDLQTEATQYVKDSISSESFRCFTSASVDAMPLIVPSTVSSSEYPTDSLYTQSEKYSNTGNVKYATCTNVLLPKFKIGSKSEIELIDLCETPPEISSSIDHSNTDLPKFRIKPKSKNKLRISSKPTREKRRLPTLTLIRRPQQGWMHVKKINALAFSKTDNDFKSNLRGKRHADQLPFRCCYCGRHFKHKRSRDRHLKLHTGDKKYKCSQCDAAFSRSDHLKIHLKTHDNQKPHQCSVCCRGYSSAAALTAHMQSHKLAPSLPSPHDKEGMSLSPKAGLSVDPLRDSRSFATLLRDSPEALASRIARDPTVPTDIRLEALALHLKKEVTEASGEEGVGDGEEERIVTSPPAASYMRCPLCSTALPTIAHLQRHMSRHHAGVSSMLAAADLPSPANTRPASAGTSSASSGGGAASASSTPSPRPGVVHSPRHGGNVAPSSSSILNALHCSGLTLGAPGVSLGTPGGSLGTAGVSLGTSVSLGTPGLSAHPLLAFMGSTTKLSCSFCAQEGFSSVHALELHIHSMHGVLLNGEMHDVGSSRPVSCELCGARLPDVAALQRHVITSHSFTDLLARTAEGVFCAQCLLPFSNPGALAEHMKLVHSSDPTNSATIAEHLKLAHSSEHSNSGALAEHMKLVQTTASSVNLLMGGDTKIVKRSQSPVDLPTDLSKKSKTDTGSAMDLSATTLLCNQCNAPFNDFESFRNHLKTHLSGSQTSSTVCPECKLTLPSDVGLENHLASHLLAVSTEYGCQACFKLFNKPDELQKHLMDIHAHQFYRCSLCKDVFDSKVSIQVHFAVKHSNECKVKKCTKCSVAFHSRSEFEQHVRNVHMRSESTENSAGYRCLLCHVTLATEAEFTTHLSTHQKQFQCTLCEEAFHVEFLLDKHMQSQHNSEINGNFSRGPRFSQSPNSEDMRCELCNINFPDESSLVNHYQKIHGTKAGGLKVAAATVSLFCAYCNEACKSRADLEAHVKLHQSSGGRHKCNICDELCPSAAILAQHKLSHIKALSGSVVCSVCRTPLSSSQQVQDHQTEHHGGALPQPCIVCKQTMLTSLELKAHSNFHGSIGKSVMNYEEIFRAHKDPGEIMNNNIESLDLKKNSLRCPLCQIKLETLEEAENHCCSSKPNSLFTETVNKSYSNSSRSPEEATKSYECIKCQKSFPTESEVEAHVAKHLETEGSNLECHICRTSFKSPLRLQCHLIEHTFEGCSSYTCYLCSAVFTVANRLQQHMLDHGFNAKPYDCHHCHQRFFFKAELENHVLSHAEVAAGKCLECQTLVARVGIMARHSTDRKLQESRHEIKSPQLSEVKKEILHPAKRRRISEEDEELKSDSQSPPLTTINNRLNSLYNKKKSESPDNNTGSMLSSISYKECSIGSKLEHPNASQAEHNSECHRESNPIYASCSSAGNRQRMPVSCNTCDRRCSSLDSRSIHELTHEGGRPYLCGSCGSPYTRKCEATKHMKTCVVADLVNKERESTTDIASEDTGVMKNIRGKDSNPVKNRSDQGLDTDDEHPLDITMKSFDEKDCNNKTKNCDSTDALSSKDEDSSRKKITCGYCSEDMNGLNEIRQHIREAHTDPNHILVRSDSPCSSCSEEETASNQSHFSKK